MISRASTSSNGQKLEVNRQRVLTRYKTRVYVAVSRQQKLNLSTRDCHLSYVKPSSCNVCKNIHFGNSQSPVSKCKLNIK